MRWEGEAAAKSVVEPFRVSMKTTGERWLERASRNGQSNQKRRSRHSTSFVSEDRQEGVRHRGNVPQETRYYSYQSQSGPMGSISVGTTASQGGQC